MRLFDLSTYGLTRSLSGHEAPITTLKVWPDGDYLVSGDQQGVVIIWDTSVFEKAWVLFDQDAMDRRRNVQRQVQGVRQDEQWICTCNTILVPAGTLLPPGAICVCNTIAVGTPFPGGGSVKRTKEMEGDACVCDTICACNTICTCNAVAGRGTSRMSGSDCICNTICTCNTVGGPDYYWYPN